MSKQAFPGIGKLLTDYLSYTKKVITDYEEVIEDIKGKKMLNNYFIGNNLTILICTLIYGAVLGAYVGGRQVLLNSIKIPLLFFVTLYISVPIFYIIDIILGSKIDFSQCLVLLITGYVMAALIMIAFTPFVLFFLLTAKEYHFTTFLTIGVSGFAGYFGIIYIYRNFLLFHTDKRWYPSFIAGCFSIILVGTQLSWVLRPYFHASDSFNRPAEGNFYVSMAEAASRQPNVAGTLLFFFGFMAFLITIILYLRNRPERPTTALQTSAWDSHPYPPPPPYPAQGDRYGFPPHTQPEYRKSAHREGPAEKKRKETHSTSSDAGRNSPDIKKKEEEAPDWHLIPEKA